MDRLEAAARQLARMRGMNNYYHRRFFWDIQFEVLVILGLGVAGFFGAEQVFLIVPFVALLGAVQSAFDANYLIFSRHYAAALDRRISRELVEDVLVAAKLEASSLLPRNHAKVDALAFGPGFSGCGFMAAFYTVFGILAYGTGLWLGSDQLARIGAGGTTVYLVLLIGLTGLSLLVGWWWFVGGEGERRLDAILADY